MSVPQQGSSPLVSPDQLLTIHGRICDEFGRLEGIRQNMLGTVPSFTIIIGAASVFTGAITKSPVIQHFLVAIGILGMFTAFALYFRELLLNHEIDVLAANGRAYQDLLHIPETMFAPAGRHKLLSNTVSTTLIYTGSFTAWFCVATWFILPGSAIFFAIGVLIVVFVLYWRLRRFVLVELFRPQEQQDLRGNLA